MHIKVQCASIKWTNWAKNKIRRCSEALTWPYHLWAQLEYWSRVSKGTPYYINSVLWFIVAVYGRFAFIGTAVRHFFIGTAWDGVVRLCQNCFWYGIGTSSQTIICHTYCIRNIVGSCHYLNSAINCYLMRLIIINIIIVINPLRIVYSMKLKVGK